MSELALGCTGRWTLQNTRLVDYLFRRNRLDEKGVRNTRSGGFELGCIEHLISFSLTPPTTPLLRSNYLSQPSTPAVLEKILKATQTTVAMKGADERELALGRLLGVSALAMSGRLASEPESAEGALKVRAWCGRSGNHSAFFASSWDLDY